MNNGPSPFEPQPLFIEIDPADLDLTDTQVAILDQVRNAPSTGDWSLVRFQEAPLEAADAPLEISFKDKIKLILSNYDIAQNNNTIKLTWRNNTADESGILTARNNTVSGLVYAANSVLAVSPLGGGLHTIVEVNQSGFPEEEHPPIFEEIEKTERDVPPMGSPLADERLDGEPPEPPVLRLLVAYTEAVAQLYADIDLFIQSAVDITNQSYANSEVGLQVELAKTHQVAFQSTGGIEQDLNLFANPVDGAMDDIHALRTEFGADICVLLTEADDFCGMADAILADDPTAFAVVNHDCAVKNLSFPHEIGHLQGARHDLDNDATSVPFNYGHGYKSQRGDGWRTIMSYRDAAHPTRIPFWSNPRVLHPLTGEPMGTVELQDNARVLNETAMMLVALRA